MNKTLRLLTNECWSSRENNFFMKKGNYKIKRDKFCIRHFYYNHEIFTVFIYSLRQYKFDFCGYENHKLTTAQINYLKWFYESKGFTQI